MGGITYDPRTEKRYAELHAEVLDFLEPVAADRRVPTLIEIYRDDTEKFPFVFLPRPLKNGLALSARSNREPSPEMKRELRMCGHLEGDYWVSEHIIEVNATRTPDALKGLEAHESGHAIVKAVCVPIGRPAPIPGTFGEVTQGYREVWDEARERAAAEFSYLKPDIGWLRGFISGEETFETDLGELYSELAANHVQPDQFLGREKWEREQLADLGKLRKLLMDEFADLAVERARSPSRFRRARAFLTSLAGVTEHVPAWAAAKLVREYGSAEEAVRRNPVIFSKDKEEVWEYISNLEVG